MKNISAWKHIFFAVFLIAILTACATSTPEPTATPPTATEVPPTSTPLPPTEIPKPTSCDQVDGTCLELTFDGENCSLETPEQLGSGDVTFLFINQDEKIASLGYFPHVGEESLQDSIDYWADGSTYGIPSWADQEKGFWVDASSGNSDLKESELVPGVHILICYADNQKIWFRGGFTVEN